jgi:hypothetical protein
MSSSRSGGNDLSTYGPTTLPLANICSFELNGIRLVNHNAAGILFQQLTSLTRLALHDDVHNILGLLSAPVPASQILHLPLLQELHCKDVDPEILLNVVTSRAGAQALVPLKQVTLELARSSAPLAGSPTHTCLTRAGIKVHNRV